MNRIRPISFIVDLVLGRAKLGDSTLKEQYSTVTRIGALLACLLGLLSFYGLQRFEPDIDIESEGQIIIENIEIPETQQFETPPPPARPSIPIESEDEDLADDLTIEETDLDNFDAWDAPLLLLLGHNLSLFLMTTLLVQLHQSSLYIQTLLKKQGLKARSWCSALLMKKERSKKLLL